MHQTILTAVKEQRTLTFTYHGERRHVEPHCYGRDKKGHDAVRPSNWVARAGASFMLTKSRPSLSATNVHATARVQTGRRGDDSDLRSGVDG